MTNEEVLSLKPGDLVEFKYEVMQGLIHRIFAIQKVVDYRHPNWLEQVDRISVMYTIILDMSTVEYVCNIGDAGSVDGMTLSHWYCTLLKEPSDD